MAPLVLTSHMPYSRDEPPSSVQTDSRPPSGSLRNQIRSAILLRVYCTVCNISSTDHSINNEHCLWSPLRGPRPMSVDPCSMPNDDTTSLSRKDRYTGVTVPIGQIYWSHGAHWTDMPEPRCPLPIGQIARVPITEKYLDDRAPFNHSTCENLSPRRGHRGRERMCHGL